MIHTDSLYDITHSFYLGIFFLLQAGLIGSLLIAACNRYHTTKSDVAWNSHWKTPSNTNHLPSSLIINYWNVWNRAFKLIGEKRLYIVYLFSDLMQLLKFEKHDSTTKVVSFIEVTNISTTPVVLKSNQIMISDRLLCTHITHLTSMHNQWHPHRCIQANPRKGHDTNPQLIHMVSTKHQQIS